MDRDDFPQQPTKTIEERPAETKTTKKRRGWPSKWIDYTKKLSSLMTEDEDNDDDQ